MERQEQFLVWLLRFTGCVILFAFLAMFLPTEWMRVAHEELLGLGPFPASPLVEYLTRSIAMLYGFHGVLVLVAATDVRRFRPIVLLCGWMNILFGSGMLLIDLKTGMPWFWTFGEGPPIALVGALILYLSRAVPRI